MKNFIENIIRGLIIVLLVIGVYAGINHAQASTAKAESIAQEYNIPINVINKRCVEGESLKHIEEQLANGDLVYYNGRLIMADYIGW